jgi:putative oxidoreductase
MTTGLLILRIVIGLLLVGHGTQKLFGWFGGPGLAGIAGWFESLGFRPSKQMAIVAGLGETVGGLLLVLGLLTPLASAIIIGTLVVAASTHLAGGLWAGNGGFELPLVYLTVAAGLAFTGAGAASLDNAFGLDLTSAWYGVAAVVVGVLAALVVIVRAKLVRSSVATTASAAAG